MFTALDEIAKAHDLLGKGVLSEAEYERIKADLLGGSPKDTPSGLPDPSSPGATRDSKPAPAVRSDKRVTRRAWIVGAALAVLALVIAVAVQALSARAPTGAASAYNAAATQVSPDPTSPSSVSQELPIVTPESGSRRQLDELVADDLKPGLQFLFTPKMVTAAVRISGKNGSLLSMASGRLKDGSIVWVNSDEVPADQLSAGQPVLLRINSVERTGSGVLKVESTIVSVLP